MEENMKLSNRGLVRNLSFADLLEKYRESSPSPGSYLIEAIRDHPGFNSGLVWQEIMKKGWPPGSNESQKQLMLLLIEVEKGFGVSLSFSQVAELYPLALVLFGVEEADEEFLGGRTWGILTKAFQNLASFERLPAIKEARPHIGEVCHGLLLSHAEDLENAERIQRHLEQQEPARAFSLLNLAGKVARRTEREGEGDETDCD
jgi:hypothetical protein